MHRMRTDPALAGRTRRARAGAAGRRSAPTCARCAAPGALPTRCPSRWCSAAGMATSRCEHAWRTPAPGQRLGRLPAWQLPRGAGHRHAKKPGGWPTQPGCALRRLDGPLRARHALRPGRPRFGDLRQLAARPDRACRTQAREPVIANRSGRSRSPPSARCAEQVMQCWASTSRRAAGRQRPPVLRRRARGRAHDHALPRGRLRRQR
jgi:hypothetical protein